MQANAHTISGAPFVMTRGLAVNYAGGVQALADITLDLADGEFVSVVGPSGCGKSTLLKVLAGLLPSTGGHWQIGAEQPAAPRSRPDVAFVFQSPTLLSWRTVAGNVRLPIELRGTADAATAARVRDTLAWVGLSEFAGAFPSQLSGGMQMRVSLARALVTRPHLLLLDEPFAALDDITRQRLNEDVSRLWQRDRWNALFVTHNVAEAVYLSQRVLVMSARPGRILADIAIPMDYPRAPSVRTSSLFISLMAEVSGALARAA